MKFSNPRVEATIENWPSGRKRVAAHFEIERKPAKGKQKRDLFRCARTTTGKPKLTTYYDRMILVDGDDGRIYIVGQSYQLGAITVRTGTLCDHCTYPKGHKELEDMMDFIEEQHWK